MKSRLFLINTFVYLIYEICKHDFLTGYLENIALQFFISHGILYLVKNNNLDQFVSEFFLCRLCYSMCKMKFFELHECLTHYTNVKYIDTESSFMHK